MEHKIVDDFYYIYDENGIVLLSIKLTKEPGNQVIISTSDEVYSGPVELLCLSGWTNYSDKDS